MSDSVTPWTVAHQAPLSMEISRKEHRSELPSPSPPVKIVLNNKDKLKTFSHKIMMAEGVISKPVLQEI